jgi:DNA-binding helix-hairpin-helix protein with protein kinase domain
LTVPDWRYGHLVSSARNLCLLFEQVHALGILFGDVSVANFLVRGDTTMVGVDTDSYQLTADGQTYPCPVGTDETTPPELQNTANFSKLLRKPEHDYFGLASLVTRLVMEGIHPFSGVVHNMRLAPPIGPRIERNLFPYSPGTRFWSRMKRAAFATPTPTASLLFAALSPGLRSLILRAFDAGHRDPTQRPTPAAWRQALQEFLQALTKCNKNPQHQYFNGLSLCHWCELVRQTGKDHYPLNP